MKAILQRVTHAKVTIDGQVSGEIGTGFLVLLGVAPEDTQEEALYLARKIAGLRVFTDENDKMNLALADVGGRLLVVSQFTLYADCRKASRQMSCMNISSAAAAVSALRHRPAHLAQI